MAKKSATKRKPKVKQGYLEGMDPPSIKEIDKAADNYVEVRDERMSLSKIEIERKAILRGAMLKHNLKNYEYDGKVVVLDDEPTVKVRKKKEESDDSED